MDDLDLVLRVRVDNGGNAQAFRQTADGVESVASAAYRAEQSMSEAQRAQLAFSQTVNQAGQHVSATGRHLNALNSGLNQTINYTGAVTRSMSGASASIASTDASVAHMATSLRSVDSQLTTLTNHVVTYANTSNQSLQSIDRQLGQLVTHLTTATRASAGLGSAAAGSYSGMTSAVNTLQSAIATLGLAKMAADTLATNREFESLRVQMVGVFGGASEGARAFDRAMDFAVKTPFELRDMTQAMTTLKNFGIEPVNSVMQALTDTAAKTGKGGQALTTVVTQLGQAWSRGSILGQDMNIITEAGIPINQALAKSLGVTVEKMIEMREHGELGREAIKGLIVELGKMSEGSSERAMDTLNGKISNLSDSWHKFQDALLQDKSEGIIKGIVSNWSAWLDEFEGMINNRQAKFSALNANSAAIAEAKRNIAALEKGGFGTFAGYLGGTNLNEQKNALANLQQERQKILETTHAQLVADAAIDAAAQKRYDASTKQASTQIENTQKLTETEKHLQNILDGQYKQMIINAAERQKISANALLAIAEIETRSGDAIRRSSAGAMGIGQILPQNAVGDDGKLRHGPAADLAKSLGVSENQVLTDLKANIDAMALYYKQKLDEIKSSGKVAAKDVEMFAAAAYNAGFGAVEKHKFNLVGLSSQTIDYAEKFKKLKSGLDAVSGVDDASTKQKTKAIHEATSAAEKLLKAEMAIAEMPNASQSERIILLEKAQKAYEDATGASDKYIQSQFIAVTAQEKLNKAYKEASDLFASGKISQAGYTEQLNSATDTFDKAIAPKFDKSTNKALEDYNALINQINNSTGQLGATNNAVFDSALGGINTLVSAFNNMSAAIDANTQSQLGLNAAKAGALADIRTSKDDEFGKAIKEKKVLYDFDKASKKLAEEKNQTELSGARQIIGATAQMFDKKSSAAKALHGIEMGIAAAEMAMKAQSIASNIAATTSGVVAGAAKFFAQSGWAAFAGIAAMIGVIGALGGTTSSPSMPSIDTKTQGTVLGDKTKSSNTAENLGKIMEDIHASEYLALLNINESIKKLNDSILAAVTGIFQRGDLATPSLPANTSSMFVNTRNEISQNRLVGQGNTLGAVMSGWQFELTQFLETKRTKDLLFGHMVKTSTSQNAVSDQTNRDVTAIYKHAGDTLIEAGKIFGIDVKDVVNAIRIPDLDIDIKDMTGEEAIKTFNAYISTSIDQMAGQVFPGLAQYQKIGEGLGETVVRVAADVGIVKSVFDNLHVTLPTTAAGLIAVSEALVLAADGTDKLATNLNNFYNKFYSETEQALDNFNFLTQNFARKSIDLPTDRLGYRDTTRNALAKAGTDSDILAAAKTRLDELTKAALAPYEKNLEIRKNNAERYGGEDARLYKLAQDEANAAVKLATKTQSEYVATLQDAGKASAENANLMLEQSANADAYYSAIEKGQKALDPAPFRTSVNAFIQQFAKVSDQAIPTSIEGYRKLINSTDTSTEAGRRLHDGLVMLAPDFVDLDDSLAGLKTELANVYVGGNDFTDTVLSLADAFGSADKAAQVLKDSIKLVYSGDDVKTMSVTAANKRFSNNAKAAGLEGLNVDDAKAGLKWITDGEIKGTLNLGDKVKIGNGEYSWADVQTWLVDNLNPIDAANKMTNGDNAASKTASTSTDDAAKKAEENAKTLLGLNTDIAKQLKALGLSDMQKSIVDINSSINDMIAKAREAGGTLPAIETLRSAKLQELAQQTFKNPINQYNRIGNSDIQNQVLDVTDSNKALRESAKALADASPALAKFFDSTLAGIDALEKSQLQNVFKDVAKEFLDIGKTDYQKNLNGIEQWSNDMIKVAPSIAKAYDITTDDAISGIHKIAAARKAALDKEAADILKNSRLSYSKLTMTDLESQLTDISVQFIDLITNFAAKGGSLQASAELIDMALSTGMNAYDKAVNQLRDNFKQIQTGIISQYDTAGDSITEILYGKDAKLAAQQTRAYWLLQSSSAQDQLSAADTLYQLTMDRYNAELDKVNKIKDAVKSINDFLLNFKITESTLSPESRLAEARAQYATTLAAAKAGDADALGKITDNFSKAVDAYKGYYASTMPTQDFIQQGLAELAGLGKNLTTSDTAEKTAANTADTVNQLRSLQDILKNVTTQQTDKLSADILALQASTNKIGQDFANAIYSLASTYNVTKDQVNNAVKPTASTTTPYGTSYVDWNNAANSVNWALFNQKVINGDWMGAANYAWGLGATKDDMARAVESMGGSYGETMNWLVMQGFAKGGYYPGGLALVGEDGPEFINFNQPGQVYTAPQTRELLQGGNNKETVAQLKEQNQKLAEQNRLMMAMIDMLQAGFNATVEQNEKQAQALENLQRKQRIAEVA